MNYRDLLALDPESDLPLFQQLYDELKRAIVEHRIQSGLLLPPSRNMAEELGLSRTTVVNAYRQLSVEGYTLTRQGSGTRVCEALPRRNKSSVKGTISRSGEVFLRLRKQAACFDFHAPAFCPALPALDHFPRDEWGRIAGRLWRKCDLELFEYGSSQGYLPLREQIAEHLTTNRGLKCRAEQIVVTNGAQQALDLCARVFLNPEDLACVEDPGYFGSRAAFQAVGARVVDCPVDEHGMMVDSEIKPQVICLSPNNQFPLGVTMPISRRVQLLNWASVSGSWVIEDDYDSEIRYGARPLEPLQSLDREGRVLYVGSFSKLMFPSLRLGYLVLPQAALEVFLGARLAIDRQLPLHDQAVLADFMKTGLYSRHLWRMREVYEERREALVSSLSGDMRLSSTEGGFHIVAWLPEDQDDQTVAQGLAAGGLEANAISFYRSTGSGAPGLLLGFGGIPPKEIKEAAEKLLGIL